MQRPLMSVSLDLDNLWSYMKTHGDAGWDALPSYLDQLAPLVVQALQQQGIRLTIFMVGQDAALERNREALRALADAGHEVGNHSFSHEPWFHLYPPQQAEDEIVRAEEAIEQATGQRPRGFRGPGFSCTEQVLRVLSRRGYDYDASTFPTFLGPLARAYYFWQSRDLPPDERRKRAQLFGTLREGLRPLRPHVLQVEGRPLVEIPVTTMPLLRAPIHLSYLLYLAGRSQSLAMAYLRAALALLQAAGMGPSMLLHPLDFLGGDLESRLSFFPGMQLPTEFKQRFFHRVMSELGRRFEPVTMSQHAAAVLT